MWGVGRDPIGVEAADVLVESSLKLCVEGSRVLGLAGGREERAGSVQHLPLFGDARVQRLGPQRAAGEARVVAMDERRGALQLVEGRLDVAELL